MLYDCMMTFTKNGTEKYKFYHKYKRNYIALMKIDL